MRLFITFEVCQTQDGEPLWRQVDWKVIESGNGYGRDAAETFANSGNAKFDHLYATVQVNDSSPSKRREDIQGGAVFYWVLTGRMEGASPEAFWQTSPPQSEEEGRPA